LGAGLEEAEAFFGGGAAAFFAGFAAFAAFDDDVAFAVFGFAFAASFFFVVAGLVAAGFFTAAEAAAAGFFPVRALDAATEAARLGGAIVRRRRILSGSEKQSNGKCNGSLFASFAAPHDWGPVSQVERRRENTGAGEGRGTGRASEGPWSSRAGEGLENRE
jgi:hypothetical protein